MQRNLKQTIMRRLFFTLLVVTFATVTFAQQKWYLKPTVGINVERLWNDPKGKNLAQRTGFELGMDGEYFVSDKFSASAGLMFSVDRYREDLMNNSSARFDRLMALEHHPELKNLYVLKVPILASYHPIERLSLSTGIEPWYVFDEAMYPDKAVDIDRLQLAIPVAVAYSIGMVDVRLKYSFSTSKIAACRPNALSLTAAIPLELK